MKESPTKAKSSRPSTTKTPSYFPVVAIGASAGGLEAMMELLKHLPPDTGHGIYLCPAFEPRS